MTMMRLLIVASILAVGSAATDENSIFSSRYLNSLEQANNADNTPSSSSFHHASSSSIMMDEAVGEYESSRQEEEVNSVSVSSHEQQRRELSWWSIALQFGELSCHGAFSFALGVCCMSSMDILTNHRRLF